jgi:hypothetical protein
MTYHIPNIDLGWLVDRFAPISLDALNEKAEMLSRIDNKYVVDRWELERILPDLLASFDILEIENRRVFTYETRYFDDTRRSAYYEHHQGLRKRFKVRVRRYADAGLSFLEIKVKGPRDMTVKHRLPYALLRDEELSNEALTFTRDTYFQHYGKPFTYVLQPTLDMRYRRVTLVAKSGGERMTLDAKLQFWNMDRSPSTVGDVFIAETKSALGRGIADKCLQKIHARPTRKCSKYCIGMAALGEVSRWNRFMPSMRRLKLMDGTKLVQNPDIHLAV